MRGFFHWAVTKIIEAFALATLVLGTAGAIRYYNPKVQVVKEQELVEVLVEPDDEDLRDIVHEAAVEYKLSEWLLTAIIKHESGMRRDAIRYESSQMGRAMEAAKKLHISNPDEVRMLSSSIGLGQIMGWHAPGLGLKSWRDLLDARKNIYATARIFRNCLDKKKSVTGALGCYNGDETRYPFQVYAVLGEMMVETM